MRRKIFAIFMSFVFIAVSNAAETDNDIKILKNLSKIKKIVINSKVSDLKELLGYYDIDNNDSLTDNLNKFVIYVAASGKNGVQILDVMPDSRYAKEKKTIWGVCRRCKGNGKRVCSYCRGTGKCQICSGTGVYVVARISGDEKRDCPKECQQCPAKDAKCVTCYGKGKILMRYAIERKRNYHRNVILKKINTLNKNPQECQKYATMFYNVELEKIKNTKTYGEAYNKLERLISECSKRCDVSEAKNLLSEYKVKRDKEIISIQIANAQKAKTYGEKFRILEKVIADYGNTYDVSAAKKLLAESKIAEQVSIARKAKTYGETFQILEKVIADYGNTYDVSVAKDTLEYYRTLQKSEQCLKYIHFDNPNYHTMIQIQKQINKDNDKCWLLVFPLSHKNTVDSLLEKMNKISSCYTKARANLAELIDIAEQLENGSYYNSSSVGRGHFGDFGSAIMNEMMNDPKVKKAQLKARAERCKYNALVYKNDGIKYYHEFARMYEQLLTYNKNKSMRFCDLNNNICNVSSIGAPVILLVIEIINYNVGNVSVPMPQGWLLEYNPSAEPKVWTLK